MGRYPDTGMDRAHRNGRRGDSRESPRRRGGYDARGYASRDEQARRGHQSGYHDEHRNRERDRKDDWGRGGQGQGRGGGSSHDRRRTYPDHRPSGNHTARGRSPSRSRSKRHDNHGHGAGTGRGGGAVARRGGGGSSSSSAAPQPKKKEKDGKQGDDDSDSDGTGDDEIIHFDWNTDMVLNSRYELLKLLGDGTFGRVVMAKDRQSNNQVAIKIIRDVKRYMENAQVEADILKDIRKADPNGTSGCAIMYDTFTHDTKFFCMIFEPLGDSLYDFLKANEYRGYWMQDLQVFAKQSMQALAFLHDCLHMTHTDLKPENVLLYTTQPARASSFPREAAWRRHHRHPDHYETKPYMRPVNNSIKIIDFGNATYEEEQHSSTINTRQYRSPEVLLSCGWNELSDQWSIGSILMELYSGNQLFETHEEMEHLALMERIIGTIPQSMIDSASRSSREKWFFFEQAPYSTNPTGAQGRWRLCWPDRASSSHSERHVASQDTLHKQVPKEHAGLADFVADLLILEPSKRKSAASMLTHPFLTKMSFED